MIGKVVYLFQECKDWIRRYKKISYYGFDIDGNKIENIAEGLHARVIQHEIDHLDGILYTSRLVMIKHLDLKKK